MPDRPLPLYIFIVLQAFIVPKLTYCLPVWGHMNKKECTAMNLALELCTAMNLALELEARVV